MALPKMVESLLSPSAYPSHPAAVFLKQTHISYLFITPQFVYKVKKPVDFGFLDFTTLRKRLFFCREEVRLNRRLAPATYLGVVPITRGKGGHMMEGKGRPVEYAVKMRRLAQSTMLDCMIEDEAIGPGVIRKVARVISGFHKRARTGPRISVYGRPCVIRKNTEENFSQVSPFVGKTIDPVRYRSIKEYTEDFIGENQGLFKERIEKNFIRDCHGDIHCEHVSVTDGAAVFDCIEFNRRFRYSDTVSDAAFLSMDLEFRQRGDLARIFDRAYFFSSSDSGGKRLLNFYKCYRAFVRGKVESFRLVEKEETEEDKRAAFSNAVRFFHLSHLYAQGGYRPMMLIVCGLTGTGKTTLALSLKEKLGIAHLSSDVLRKRLFSLRPEERRYGRFASGIYSREATLRTYSTLIEEGRRLLSSGRAVMLDATFSKGKYLTEARKAAEGCGAFFYLVECRADEKAIKKRFEKRLAEKGGVSDATWEVYKRQKKLFEEIKSPNLVVSTTVVRPETLAEKVIERAFSENP